MNSYKNIPRIVGALFIIGTIAGILSLVFTRPVLNDLDYLTKVSVNENRIIIGALFALIMGLALAMVPVVIFPIFRKYNEPLALGYVVFRGALEAVFDIAIVIIWLLLLTVSQEYVKAGAPDASHFQTLGTLLLKATDRIDSIVSVVFSLGALMINYIFFQSKLIPLWLSVWGLIGAIMYLAVGLFSIFSIDIGILMAPLGVQEMVMAVWLIVKGFSPSAVASKTSITA